MRDDQKERLDVCLGTALDKVAEALEESGKHSFSDKEGRGTLAWIGKGASQFLSIAVKLEELLNIGKGIIPNNQRGKTLEQQAEETIQRAQIKMAEKAKRDKQNYS